MIHKRNRRLKSWLGAGAVLSVVSVAALSAAPAYAAGSQTISSNLYCQPPITAYIATESTSKGTSVEHALQKWNNAGQLSRVNLGSSSVYSRWGWTFWTNESGGFVAIGNGSYGAVKAGSLSRWCTTIPLP